MITDWFKHIVIVGYKDECRLTGVGKYTDTLCRLFREKHGSQVELVRLGQGTKFKRFFRKYVELPIQLIFSPNDKTYIIADESMMYLRLFMLFKRVGVIIHDRRDLSLYKQGLASIRDLISYAQGAVFIPKFDFIITVSEFTKGMIHHSNVIVIPNLFERILDEAQQQALLDNRRMQPQDFNYIIYVGSDEPRKNFPTAAAVAMACYKSNNMRMVVVGIKMGSPTHLQYQHNPAFDFRFNASESDLNYLYQHAFCLVNPSLYEGFGRVVIEAQLNGCPVISTQCSSLSEVLLLSAILVNNSFIIDEYVNAISKLLSQPDYLGDIVELGYLNSYRYLFDNQERVTYDE